MLPKGYNVQINSFLHSSEIHCKCNRNECHYTLLGQATADSFFNVRRSFGKPLYLNSFFRCQKHNSSEDVGGVDTSSHTTGLALDIRTTEFTKAQKARLVKICKKYFDYVKVYDHFIHCQLNPEQDLEGGMCNG